MLTHPIKNEDPTIVAKYRLCSERIKNQANTLPRRTFSGLSPSFSRRQGCVVSSLDSVVAVAVCSKYEEQTSSAIPYEPVVD